MSGGATTMSPHTSAKVKGLFSFVHSRKKTLQHLQNALFSALAILVVFEFVVVTVFLFSDEQTRLKQYLDSIEMHLERNETSKNETITIEIARQLAPELIWELAYSYVKTLKESIPKRFYVHIGFLIAYVSIFVINMIQTTRSMLSNTINICLILIMSYTFMLNAATAMKFRRDFRVQNDGGIIYYYFADKYQSFYSLSGIQPTDNLKTEKTPILHSMLISIFELIICYAIVIIYILQMLLVQLKLDRERNAFENPLVNKGVSLNQIGSESEPSSEYSHLSMVQANNYLPNENYSINSPYYRRSVKTDRSAKQRASKLQYPGDNLGAGEADVYAISPDYEPAADHNLEYITLDKIDEKDGDFHYLKEEKVEPDSMDFKAYDKQFLSGKEAYQDKLMRMNDIMTQQYQNHDDQ